jgi:DNA-binding transcriptional ArsR family regulator
VDNGGARVVLSDPRVMRALAHPARVAILDELAGGRVGTATEFAEVCGLTPSATSYHLRALARAGLVEEAPSRGDGRERLWRGVGRGGVEISPDIAASADARKAAVELLAMFMARDDAQARVHLASWQGESSEWFDASAYTQMRLVVTAEELGALNRQIADLLLPYSRSRRTDPPPGGRNVSVTYRAFPLPEPPADPSA